MKLKLERWLAVCFFSLTVIFVGVVSVGFYTQLREAVLNRTRNQLLSINILKKQLVEQYLLSVPDTVDSLAISTPGRQVVAGLEEIMTERTGMGTTGESYLVNEQGKMMTVSRFFPDTLRSSITVDTEGFRLASAGDEGVGTYPDYRGVPIIGAYRKIEVPQGHWVILTEIDVAEAMQPLVILRNRFLWLSLALLLISGAISVWLARQLSRPIRALQSNITMLAQGKLPKRQARASRIKEIGSISASLNDLIRALNQTVRFAQHIGSGKFDTDYSPLSPQDELGHALLTMRHQLVQLNTQKDHLEREAKNQLVNAQEAERERIARDIHDGIGPLITAAKLRLSSMPSSPAQEEVKQLLNDVIAELRQISRNLMPAVLRDFGPGEALNQLVEQIRGSADLQFHYVNDLSDESRLTREVGIALYRVAQEAISNTLKHAAATEVAMSLTEFDNLVVFYYRDNGRGLEPGLAEVSSGWGLKNIQERIRILGGSVHIYSESGVIIEAEIPLHE